MFDINETVVCVDCRKCGLSTRIPVPLYLNWSRHGIYNTFIKATVHPKAKIYLKTYIHTYS